MTTVLDERLKRLSSLNDPCLGPLFEARDEAERDRALERIVVDEAHPLIRRVLSGAGGRRLRPEDVEDLTATIDVVLVQRLRSATVVENAAITSFPGFVATLAFRTFTNMLRRRSPEQAHRKETFGPDGAPPPEPVDREPGPLPRMESREYLTALWEEVGELPVAQRVALLLNLRDGQRSDVLALLVLVGIATIPQIAAALGMPAERLAALWSSLPLDDKGIASMLAVTRQQVINLRKTARERLARRMKARERNEKR